MENKDQKADSSAFKSEAWRSQTSAWQLTNDLWQSPLYIREQGEKYLEKFRKEKPEKYEERKSRSVPRNKFRESIETMAGMVFKDDPAPENAPTALSQLFSDIDGCGNSLHSFLLRAFELFLRDGGGSFWIDATPVSESAKAKIEDGGRPTAADRINDRPFWKFVEARQVINHRFDRAGGFDALAQVTIECKEIEPAGSFGEESVLRHYVLRPGEFDVYEANKETQEFEKVEAKSGSTGLDIVPLTPLAAFGTPPPMLDMAMLTVQLYNKISDFDNWCHTACVPRQVIKLKDESDAKKYKELNQSAEVGLILFGEHADAKMLEVSGSGLDVASKSIDDLRSEIAAIGIGMLAPREIAPRSATEVLDTAGQRQSKLARFAREFENAVEKALYITAEYLKVIHGAGSVDLKETEDVSLKLKMDFDRLTFDPQKIAVFEKLLANGDISHETFFEILGRSMEMPEGWTPELEVQRLAAIGPVISANKLPNENLNPLDPNSTEADL